MTVMRCYVVHVLKHFSSVSLVFRILYITVCYDFCLLCSSQDFVHCIFQCKGELCLFSCNVNGLRDYQKRSKIIDHNIFPKSSDPRLDIFTFQETHSSTDVQKAWVHQFQQGTKIIMSHGTSTSKGVLLGFAPHLDVTVVSMRVDNNGQYIVANAKIQGEAFTVVALYIHPSLAIQEKLDLLQEIMQEIAKGKNTRVIMCGDFNMVLNQQLDAAAGTINGADSAVRVNPRFNDFFEQHELTDAWRAFHPEEKTLYLLSCQCSISIRLCNGFASFSYSYS